MLRLGGEPPLTRLAVWLSSQECTIEIGKAGELGYEPVISREAGLARSCAEPRRRPDGCSSRATTSFVCRAWIRSLSGPILDDLQRPAAGRVTASRSVSTLTSSSTSGSRARF